MKPENNSTSKILIVDDDYTILSVLRKILERAAYTVFEASNGAEALKVLKEKKVNLVISDVYMPELSGIDLLAEIKKFKSAIPVILVTGKASVEAAVECMKIGALDYISKPLSLSKIEETVAKALEYASNSQLVPDLARSTHLQDHPCASLGYDIVGRLGEGNMGAVYQVEKEIEGKKGSFALKVFKPIDCTEEEIGNLRTRFLHEAQAASSVKHPNIVEIVEFGVGEDEIAKLHCHGIYSWGFIKALYVAKTSA